MSGALDWCFASVYLWRADAQRPCEMRLIVPALYAATIANRRGAALQGAERSVNWFDKQWANLDLPMVAIEAGESSRGVEMGKEECDEEIYLDAIDLA